MLRATLTYQRPLGVKAREFKSGVKAALSKALAFWHQNYLKEHFASPQALASRYPGVFRQRSRSYQIRKAKRGTTDLLTFPKRSEPMLRNNVMRGITITGSSTTVRGRLPGSQVANFWNGRTQNVTDHGKTRTVQMPNMREELTAINEAEVKVLQFVVKTELENFMKAPVPAETILF